MYAVDSCRPMYAVDSCRPMYAVDSCRPMYAVDSYVIWLNYRRFYLLTK